MKPMKEFHPLHKLAGDIFARAGERGLTWYDLAVKAGLNYATVRRLATCTTRYPRAQTILLMAKAVGCKVDLADKRPRLRVVG